MANKENVAGDGHCTSGDSGTLKEGGLIVVALVGQDGATWTRRKEWKPAKQWVKARDLMDESAALHTRGLNGNDLREKALYGFALLRSWSVRSVSLMPVDLSFHLRAVLNNPGYTQNSDCSPSFMLCHEVLDAISLNEPLLVQAGGDALKDTDAIFNSCRELWGGTDSWPICCNMLQ